MAYDTVCGMAWHGMAWYGMVWYAMVCLPAIVNK